MTVPDPPRAATVEGHLQCSHSGSLALTGHGSPGRLAVGGKAVVLLDQAPTGGTYDGCTVKDSQSAPQPCDATGVTGSSRLTVDGRPVLLTSASVTVTNPLLGALPGSVDPGQHTLTLS